MAFSASGTDYDGFQRSRDRADEGLTRALDAKGRAEKQARIKKSGERSGLQKLGSAVARGAAAYYTGGLSETMGGGDMIDSAMLGTDSEGNAVKNEYGGLIKAGSGVYQGMKARKASDVAKKRASNLSDYNEQVAMAEKVGKYDPAEGLNMLTQAQDLRTLQQRQTQKGEDASLWGWDNKFDDLGMTPSQIKGQQVAQERQALQESRTSDRENASGRGIQELGKQREDRIRMPTPSNLPQQSVKEGTSDEQELSPTAERIAREDAQKEKKLSNIDREYDKRILDKRGASFAPGSGISNAELEANNEGRNALIEAQNKIPSYFEPSIGKTYSEKEAEELSRRDTDKARTGSMDDIAIDSEGNRLTERYSGLGGGLAQKWDSVANPEDAQLYFEHQQRQKEALDRERARTGGPMASEGRQRASSERPESRFKKRILHRQALDRISDAQLMDSLKNIGGINA